MHPKLFYRIKNIITKTGNSWDSLSPSEEHAIEYAHKYINTEPPRYISNTQKYTAAYILARYGTYVNKNLRTNREDQDVTYITKVLSQNSCKKDFVIYRGVYKETFKQMKNAAKKLTHVDLYDKGFLQASLVKGKESTGRYIQLRIFIPIGTNVIYLGNVNQEESLYYEVDVQRGAKLKIISMDKEYLNCILLETI